MLNQRFFTGIALEREKLREPKELPLRLFKLGENVLGVIGRPIRLHSRPRSAILSDSSFFYCVHQLLPIIRLSEGDDQVRNAGEQDQAE